LSGSEDGESDTANYKPANNKVAKAVAESSDLRRSNRHTVTRVPTPKQAIDLSTDSDILASSDEDPEAEAADDEQEIKFLGINPANAEAAAEGNILGNPEPGDILMEENWPPFEPPYPLDPPSVFETLNRSFGDADYDPFN
jgi:hypothetical protein